MKGQVKLLWVIIFLFTGFASRAQNIIRVLDKQTGAGLPFANLCFESLPDHRKSYATTGTEGSCEFSVKAPTVLAVSFVGYISKIDTLHPGENKTIYLEMSANSMDEVIVTGQFKPQVADKSIYKVEVIGGNQIGARAASNLGDLLQADLSFRTSQSTAFGTGISIQGLSGEHVKILIDGVPVIGRQGGILDLGQMNLYNVDHVEIVKGPMSVVYGSNALAGAINIITKSSTRESLGANVNAYYESVGVYNFDAAFIKGIKTHTFRINAARNFFSGFSPIDTGRVQVWKPKMQYTGDFDWMWNPGLWKIRAMQSWLGEEVRNKGGLQFPFYEIARDEYYYTTRHTSKLITSRSWASGAGMTITTAWSYYQKRKKTMVKDLTDLSEIIAAPENQDTTVFRNAMLRGTWFASLGKKIDYQAGLDLSYDDATGKRISGKKELGDYAAFFSLQWKAKENFTLQPGVRIIYNTKYNAPLVHSLNMLWDPEGILSLRASVGRGFRSPAIKELYLNFQDVNHNVTGNPDLLAEYSWNYNLSATVGKEFERIRLSADIDLFYNRITDKIDLVYKDKDPKWAQYFNIPGLYKTRGIETKLQFALHPRFQMKAGVNLTGRSRLSDRNTYYYTRDYAVDWTYHNLKYDFRLAMFYKYTDALMTATANFDVDMNLMELSEFYQGSYQTIDFTLARPFFRKRLDVSLGGKNLFDVTNIITSGNSGTAHSGGSGGEAPMGWGRTWFVKLSWQFSKFR
jgi:outer membrane receptor for ferrienterochelin and colicins